MKLHTILLSITALAMVAHAGLFSHDKAYYDADPKKAEEKFKECDKALAHAMIDKNLEKSQEIRNDAECKAAHQAYKEHKKIIRQNKYRARNEKKALEKKEQEKSFKVEYDNQITQLKSLNYDKFMSLQKEVCLTVPMFGNGLSLKDAKCKAWKDLKQSKENEAVNSLLTTYPHAKILEYKNQVCKNVLFDDPKCQEAKLAFEKEKKNVIESYLLNKDLLKKDFNTCYNKIITLNKSSKYKESQEVLQSYKCYLASQAATKLNIYGYYNPMK